jgi:hypothetical protein
MLDAISPGAQRDDRSGDRLREWLALDRIAFYDEARTAIMPIGLCYPGRDARGGDRPPRPSERRVGTRGCERASRQSS